jgi:hypothetical protein
MLIFYSHIEAGKHFKCDPRTAKNNLLNIEYTIDKSSEYNPNSLFKTCKKCKNKYTSSKCRAGYCPSCKNKISKKVLNRVCKICSITATNINPVSLKSCICKECSQTGIGKKLQAIFISNLQTGVNNSNFVHGNSTIKIWQNSKWVKLRKNYPNKVCLKCGKTTNIHLHHIIPQCLLPHEEKFNLDNIIPLCSNHHKELHHLQLDIVLLPSLYLQYKKDAQQLQQFFYLQPQFQSMSLTPLKKYDDISLVQLTPKNYYKTIQKCYPEFFQQEFAHLV